VELAGEAKEGIARTKRRGGWRASTGVEADGIERGRG